MAASPTTSISIWHLLLRWRPNMAIVLPGSCSRFLNTFTSECCHFPGEGQGRAAWKGLDPPTLSSRSRVVQPRDAPNPVRRLSTGPVSPCRRAPIGHRAPTGPGSRLRVRGDIDRDHGQLLNCFSSRPRVGPDRLVLAKDAWNGLERELRSVAR